MVLCIGRMTSDGITIITHSFFLSLSLLFRKILPSMAAQHTPTIQQITIREKEKRVAIGSASKSTRWWWGGGEGAGQLLMRRVTIEPPTANAEQ